MIFKIKNENHNLIKLILEKSNNYHDAKIRDFGCLRP